MSYIAMDERDWHRIAQEVPADAPCDARGGGLDRVPRQVRVPCRRLNLGVASSFPIMVGTLSVTMFRSRDHLGDPDDDERD